MYYYTNAFACALDTVADDFVVQFCQNTPVFSDSSNDIANIGREVLCSVIMRKDKAKSLADAIYSILENSDNAPDKESGNKE